VQFFEIALASPGWPAFAGHDTENGVGFHLTICSTKYCTMAWPNQGIVGIRI
jgi:hypothetical protein